MSSDNFCCHESRTRKEVIENPLQTGEREMLFIIFSRIFQGGSGILSTAATKEYNISQVFSAALDLE